MLKVGCCCDTVWVNFIPKPWRGTESSLVPGYQLLTVNYSQMLYLSDETTYWSSDFQPFTSYTIHLYGSKT